MGKAEEPALSGHHSHYTPYPRPSTQPIAGTSTDPVPADEPLKKKRGGGRKKAGEDGELEPEKRLARYKKSCPKNILDRVDRVMSQRFFMIHRSRQGDDLREEFQVLGSTGNVYTVTIDRMPRCSCPDSQKGNHCKHILFVFLKVLGQPANSPHYYQKALLTPELAEIFERAPAAPTNPDAQTARVRTAYAEATGKAPAVADVEAGNGKKRLPSKDDSCPVCYEDFEEGQDTGLVFCLGTCGGAVHAECHRQWAVTVAKKGEQVLCVYCRGPWVDPPGTAAAADVVGKGKGVVGPDGYLNLGAAAGFGPQRDTSSYYHGPRRGEKYNIWSLEDRYQ